MPVHPYTNWNRREEGDREQTEPYRKYFFICGVPNENSFLVSPSKRERDSKKPFSIFMR